MVSKAITMMLFSAVSFQVLATDDAPQWFYANGERVPESAQETLLKQCKFAEAADRIANVKEGEFDAAFAMLMQARDCIIANGIRIEPVHDNSLLR